MLMFDKRTIAAVFAIAIALSLIVVSGFVGSALAAKKVKQHDAYGTNPSVSLDKDKSSIPAVLHEYKSGSLKSQSANADDSGWTMRDANGISAKEIHMWKEICNT
jgi:hypothetical protein